MYGSGVRKRWPLALRSVIQRSMSSTKTPMWSMISPVLPPSFDLSGGSIS
jgi:hypothetical protein